MAKCSTLYQIAYLSLLALCLIMNAIEQFISFGANFVYKRPVLFTLNVAIISARENFQKRQTIRNSWLNHVDWLNKIAADHEQLFIINAHFVLGKEGCAVHPVSRDELFGCERRNLSFVKSKSWSMEKSISIFNIIEGRSTDRPSRTLYKGFSFKTYNTISLQRIGVLRTLIDRLGPFNVTLLNAFTKERIHQVTIFKEGNQWNKHFYFAGVGGIDLVSSTYILIVEHEIDNVETLEISSNIRFSEFSPFLRIIRSYFGSNDYESKVFNKNEDFYLVSFDFCVKEIDINQTFLTDEKNDKTWRRKMKIIDKKLLDESKTYGDIYFVDVLDVYRNLPEKMLYYFKTITPQRNDVTHVLKTDDDCYINLFLVVELLLRHHSQKFSWFGNFRKHWSVNYYGKWSDNIYSSPIYPAFACGSGYILTRDLVDFLSVNSDRLRRYQGEDVSTGIWLAAIDPQRIEVKKIAEFIV